jgi:hypothetical protein
MSDSLVRDIKKTFIDFFGGIRLYCGGVIFFGDHTAKLKGPDVREIIETLEPGDIVLNRHDHYVSSLFIGGDFSHAGLCVAKDRIIHVGINGITEEDILTFTRADAFAIIRSKDRELANIAIERAYKYLEEGVQYDYDFDKYSDDYFYCSEFTDSCYGYLMRDNVSETFIRPSDYLLPNDYFEVVLLKKKD